ncbi:TetR family transcriptional regulator [Kribbella solani]|uniref:AcrR family transcriptional regulator n=1 Tax=Kribbella solani TaxID=236067 RepID=A0A841E5U1_9ACTN|nr:TetR family transcriptional regulator [Kribbella solani]MBB5983717.1 AcrR family transcriptional regulator [Kribbella solani]
MSPVASRRNLPARSRTPSAQQTKSEQTELKLLQTATWLFSERGFHGTSIRDIADAAEVAVSALYYYTNSKDRLLEEIMRRSLGVLTSSAEAAVDGFGEPAERLALLVGSHAVFHARNPRSAAVTDHEFTALSGKVRREILGLRDNYEALWKSVCEAGVRDGTFAERGSVARLALLQMTTGIAHWYRARGELGVPELWEQFATMSLSLMGAERDGERLTFASLELPAAELLIDRAHLPIEPRRKPSGI